VVEARGHYDGPTADQLREATHWRARPFTLFICAVSR
jgi:hypothetical protein